VYVVSATPACGGRTTITFKRPEVLNAVDYQLLSEMNQALKGASWDDSVGVLVLTGAGERAFCQTRLRLTKPISTPIFP